MFPHEIVEMGNCCMQKRTTEWVRKAEADWFGVLLLDKVEPRLNDGICFHSQQAAEKYLKALLQELGLPVPCIHDLEQLLDLLLPHDSTLKGLHRNSAFLSQYAEDAEDYWNPGKTATTRQAKSAVRSMKRIREELRRRLGLPI